MNALQAFVTKTSTNYLQSVVFVDDNIYESKDGKLLEDSLVPTGLGSGLESQFSDDAPQELEASGKNKTRPSVSDGTPISLAIPEEQPSNSVEPAHYHPRELMESFAQKGIVCALYEPRKGPERVSRPIRPQSCSVFVKGRRRYIGLGFIQR